MCWVWGGLNAPPRTSIAGFGCEGFWEFDRYDVPIIMVWDVPVAMSSCSPKKGYLFLLLSLWEWAKSHSEGEEKKEALDWWPDWWPAARVT